MREIMMHNIKYITDSAEISSLLRRNLKLNNINASVVTQKYSMGSTINVDLKDEELTDDEIKEIKEFCRKFEDNEGCYPNRHVKVTINGSNCRRNHNVC